MVVVIIYIMTIMRSMKDRLKVRRKTVNWKDVLYDLEDSELFGYYWVLKTKHPSMSDNRCAYQSLRHRFSKRSLGIIRMELGK